MKKKRSTRSESKKRSRRKRHLFADFLTVIICLAGIAGALYCFRGLIYVSLANDTDTPVGTITFKKKSPRRRLQHENVWEYLKLQSTIYKGDYILTEDLSEAQLIFKDNNYVVDEQEGNVSRVVYDDQELEQIKTGTADIYANSMMKVGDDRLLHFISGSVSLKSGSRTDDLKIKVGDNIYTLEKNTSALFSMGTQKSEDGKQTATVYVSSGKVHEQDSVTEKKSEIGAGQVKSVQVVAETAELKANDSVVPGVVKTAVQKTVAVTKKQVADTSKKTTGAQTEAAKTPASFSVLVPSASYSITQNKQSKEAIPFYWTNINSIKVEFSYNANFNPVIDTEYFTSTEHKGSVVLGFANADDVLYWRAIPSDQNYSKTVQYPQGKILVHDPEEKNLKKALTAVYGKERAAEIEQAVNETVAEQEKQEEQIVEALKPARQELSQEFEQEQKIQEEEAAAQQEKIDEIRNFRSGKTDEEERLAEEARIAEEERLRKEEEARIAEEKRKAEEARKKEEARKAEEKRLAE